MGNEELSILRAPLRVAAKRYGFVVAKHPGVVAAITFPIPSFSIFNFQFSISSYLARLATKAVLFGCRRRDSSSSSMERADPFPYRVRRKWFAAAYC